MSQAKREMEENEQKKINIFEGYRKHLHKENKYNMDCPYCCNALGRDDIKKTNCIHCGYELKWNSID